jgi:YcxB-like protein
MIVKTKKYKLETGTYIKEAMVNILVKQWWVGLIVVVLASGYLIIPNLWWFWGTAIALILYLLFWLIQFTGVTQLEQSKILFEKLSYEISSQQVMIKLSSKQGMPISWDQIKKAKIGKNKIVLIVNSAQMVYLPFKIFKTDNERKFVETILKRKGLIKE